MTTTLPTDDADSMASSAWSKVYGHPIITSFIAGFILLLISYFVFGIGRSHDPAPPGRADSTPDNVIEEVAARPFWTAAPRVYESATQQRVDGNENDIYDGTVSGGDVVAVTPRDLTERTSQYAGRSIYLVGKVTAQADINTKHGLTTEFEIHGTDPGFVAYMAQDDQRIGRAPTGAVIYALGRLVAAGEATDGRGRRVKAVYFFCFHFCDFESVRGFRATGSDAIRRAARGLHESTTSDFVDTP